MRARGILVLVGIIVLFAVVESSLVKRIPPEAMTLTAIGESQVRIHVYMLKHRDYPSSLADLPTREGYANCITDGWGYPLLYNVDDDGVISLTSLGQDGAVGGNGDNKDITRRYRTRNTDGKLNIDDEFWIVDSEIVDGE
jgi:hypothetical protein